MNKAKNVPASVVFGALLLASLPAAAVEQGFYVGGYYGMSDIKMDESVFAFHNDSIYADFGFFPFDSESRFDSEDDGYGFFGGYRMNRNIAFEAAYMEIGETTFNDDSIGFFDDGSANPPVENWTQSTRRGLSGIAVSALGIWPLTYRAELFGRAGAMFSSTELRVHLSDGIGELSGETSESDVDWLVGIGGSFTFADIYAIRLEYQRVFDAGKSSDEFTDAALGESDVDIISLGFSVTF